MALPWDSKTGIPRSWCGSQLAGVFRGGGLTTVQARTSEIQRLGKALESAQLTELRGRIAVCGKSARVRAATFPAQDQRR